MGVQSAKELIVYKKCVVGVVRSGGRTRATTWRDC